MFKFQSLVKRWISWLLYHPSFFNKAGLIRRNYSAALELKFEGTVTATSGNRSNPFQPIFHFYTPLKRQKSGPKMGYILVSEFKCLNLCELILVNHKCCNKNNLTFSLYLWHSWLTICKTIRNSSVKLYHHVKSCVCGIGEISIPSQFRIFVILKSYTAMKPRRLNQTRIAATDSS